MNLIGYWKASPEDPYPRPQDVGSMEDSALRAKVVAYLRAGDRFLAFCGTSECRYGCGENGSKELSDGVWYWPEGLAHYVEAHHVALPQDFLSHVQVWGDPKSSLKESKRTKKGVTKEEIQRIVEGGFEEYWIQWGRGQSDA